jgi:hypothetical protein
MTPADRLFNPWFRRRLWRAPMLGWAVACALIALGGGSVWAADAVSLRAPLKLHERVLALRYDVYVGGFYVFGFDASVGLDRGAYAVTLEGNTRGLLSRFWTWRLGLSSSGAASSPADLVPAEFDSTSEWRGKPRRTTLRFTGGGHYAIERDPSEPQDRDADTDDDLPASLPVGTMDPIAASLAALAASGRDGTCERRIPVFDGKRRYDLIVHNDEGTTTLHPSNFSAYAGPALTCRIALDRISGFSARRTAHYWDDNGGNLPVIWAASLASGLPMVPVRFMAPMTIAGNVGTMVIHLVHAEVQEKGATHVLVELNR